MEFCKSCGSHLTLNAAFCPSCGADAPPSSAINFAITDKSDTYAKVGLILGLCGAIAWILPFVGFPVTITGIVLSVKGMSSSTKKNQALAGLILSIIFLIVTVINSVLGAMLNLQ